MCADKARTSREKKVAVTSSRLDCGPDHTEMKEHTENHFASEGKGSVRVLQVDGNHSVNTSWSVEVKARRRRGHRRNRGGTGFGSDE